MTRLAALTLTVHLAHPTQSRGDALLVCQGVRATQAHGQQTLRAASPVELLVAPAPGARLV